ncbi:MAG: hypothetical protein VW338_00265 [Rhodospirillaceae bacterium]
MAEADTLDAAAPAEPSIAEQIRARREVIEASGGVAGIRARQEVREVTREGQIAESVGQATLGPPGLQDTGARADIGLSNSFIEKKMKFHSYYPEGNFIEKPDPMAPSNPIILFRPNQETPFAKFDAEAMETFEPFGDLADIAGEVPAVVLEALVGKGRSVLGSMLRNFWASTTGDAMREAVEDARGFQKDEIDQIIVRGVGQGAFAAAGVGTTVAVSGPLNWLRGAPAIGVKEGAQRAQTMAANLGVPRLHPGQVSDWPLLQKLTGQARETMPDLQRYERDQRSATSRALLGLRDEDVSRALGDDLSKLHDDARKQVVEAAIKNPRHLSEGGSAIQNGIKEYEDLSRMAVNKKYADARAIETPDFDPSSALAVARNIEEEAAALGRDLPKDVTDAIASLRNFDPAAEPTTLSSGVVIDATAKLRAIRTDLWDMKTLPVGGTATPEQRQSARLAGQLYTAIGRVLDDPKNTTPEFRKAWSEAAQEASARFTTMEKLIVVKAARDETPAQLALRLAKPNQVDNLRTLREIMPDDKWKAFTDAAISDMVDSRNINSLAGHLRSFDKETLNTLLSPTEQITLKQVAERIDRLNDLGLPDMLGRQARRGDIAYDLLVKGDRGKTKTFTEMIGANPAVRKEVRAGLIDSLIARNVDTVEGLRVIKWEQYNRDLDKMLDNGALKFLTPNDVRVLRDLKVVGQFLPDASDAGTSIAAASTASGIFRGRPTALLTAGRLWGLGRLLTTESGQRALLGSDRKVFRGAQYPALRVAGAIAAELLSDFSGGEETPGAREEPQAPAEIGQRDASSAQQELRDIVGGSGSGLRGGAKEDILSLGAVKDNVPANARAYVLALSGGKGPITESFFSGREIDGLKQIVSEALKKGKKSISYEDYTIPGGWGASVSADDDTVSGIVDKSYNSLTFNLMTTLGGASISTSKSGDVIVKDVYDFNSAGTPPRKTELNYKNNNWWKEGIPVRDIFDAFISGEKSAYESLRSLGATIGPLAGRDDKGIPVEINLGNPKDWATKDTVVASESGR